MTLSEELVEAERKYPGITKHGCFDPYYDFKLMNSECTSCPRYDKCKNDAVLEIMRSETKLDMNEGERIRKEKVQELMKKIPHTMRKYERKKKSIKPKSKRKVCRCKK